MTTATKSPKKEKKIVPMMFYREDMENAEFLIKHYRVSQAALTRKLYREERERITGKAA